MSTEINPHFERGATATGDLRRVNREALLGRLARHGTMSRRQLAEEAALTPAAISRIARELIDAGLLVESETASAGRRVGRREQLLSINPAGASVLAMSLTANRRAVTLAAANGDVIASDDLSAVALSDPLQFLSEASQRAKNLVFDAKGRHGRLLGVGVSAAIAEDGRQVIDDPVTIKQLAWRNVPVRSVLAQSLRLPVRVERRASAILRAELNQSPDEVDTYLINVALGFGVSGYLDGRLLAGGSRGLGRLSHLARPGDNTLCECGRQGCMEATASGRAILVRLLGQSPPLEQQAKHLEDAVRSAAAGDPAAVNAFYEAGRCLAFGVDAVAALLNPQKIVLSGEVGRQPDYVAGLRAGLCQAGAPDLIDRLSRSNVTSAQAAIGVALQEFVLTGSLDLAKLGDG